MTATVNIWEEYKRQREQEVAAAQQQAKRDAILAMGMSLLGTRKGRELEGLGKAGLLGLATARNTAVPEGPSLRDMLAMQEYEAKQQARAAVQAQQEAMRRAGDAAYTPGSPGMPAYGPPTQDGGMQPEVPATPGRFDPIKYADNLRAERRYDEAAVVEAKYKKDAPFATPKPEDFTPESRAKFAQTGNWADLVKYEPPKEPPKLVGTPNPSDFTPDSIAAYVSSGGDYNLLKPIDKTPRTTVNVDARQPPPKDHRWSADGRSLEVIPGSATAREIAMTEGKTSIKVEAAMQRADLVQEKVRTALKQTGLKSAGLGGAVMAHVPGSGAVDLRATVDTIKANIGFQELQAMREASPTGGALGQVAVQELQMLQAVISSLDTAQSPAQLRSGLMQVDKHYNNWKSIVKKAGVRQPSGGGWSITEEK